MYKVLYTILVQYAQSHYTYGKPRPAAPSPTGKVAMTHRKGNASQAPPAKTRRRLANNPVDVASEAKATLLSDVSVKGMYERGRCWWKDSLYIASRNGRKGVSHCCSIRGRSAWPRRRAHPLCEFERPSEVCALLLDRGANVDRAAQDGCTPLLVQLERTRRSARCCSSRGQRRPGQAGWGHYSLQVRTATKRSALLDRGANVNHSMQMIPGFLLVGPSRRVTPLDLAIRQGHTHVCELLLFSGGNVGEGFYHQSPTHRQLVAFARSTRVEYPARFRCMLLCLQRCLPRWRSGDNPGMSMWHRSIPPELLRRIHGFVIPGHEGRAALDAFLAWCVSEDIY